VRSGWQGAWDILGFTGETIPAELRLMAGKARQGEREIMGNKISPTVIGAFVVGAIVCMVAGVLLFGGGKFFTEKLPYVLFFDSSVEGLHVGAPVIFRGVKVGQVAAIEAIADPKTFTVVIRVQVELVRGSIKVSGGEFTDPHQAIEGLIQQGARASLRMQSFVTGVLYVAVDFHPDTPIKRLGLDPRYPELPTIPSDIDMLKSTVQQVMADLGKLPLEAVLNEVLVLLKQTNSLVALPEVKQALVSLQDVVTAAERLLQHADTQVSALGPRLAGAADTARAALVEAQKLLRDVDGQVTPLAGSAQDTLTAARGTLGQAHKSLVKLTDAASPALKQAEQTLGGADGMIHQDLAHTLKALEEAAKSIRALAETLQRHPESLLRGR
jgi:paraquat-inducible protein B